MKISKDARTKIICTIGPSTRYKKILRQLIEKGMDVARLNFSHNTHSDHLNSIQMIRSVSQQIGKEIPIIADLQGPKIRIRTFEKGYAELKDNVEFIITTEDTIGNDKIVSTNHLSLPNEVKIGSTILLDDGYIILKVTKVEPKNIYTRVVKGGKLLDKKGIVVPGVKSTAPSIGTKDLEDLKFALENGIDLVALSFVRSSSHIIELRSAMKAYGKIVPIIAKIERFEALQDITAIINEADGIMVARGDLGLEVEAEKVPILQKEILQKARYFGKPSIIATQMLESMISNPRPTRAEASDVANAVLDGADCLMLSGETSIGKYPIEAVDYMNRIILEAEKNSTFRLKYRIDQIEMTNQIWDAIARASCILAEQIKAKAIVAITKRGFTSINLAKYRPSAPIIALTESKEVVRRIGYIWGVVGISVNGLSEDIKTDEIKSILTSNFNVRPADTFVVTSCGNPNDFTSQNMIKIVQLTENS